jgi:putative ABC transport system substrate-binding protein
MTALALIVMLALGILVAPLAAEAQPSPTIPRIGVLSSYSPTAEARNHDAFRQELHALGYVEGQTIVLEERWADGQPERLPALAAELVRLPVALIVAANVPAARAAHQATERLPIVLAGGDAVGTGLITNIARPDGNITGLATNAAELIGKWLALLKEAVPALAHVAVLVDPNMPITGPALHEMQDIAPGLGVQLHALSVRDLNELEGAFAAMHREHADALVVVPGSLAYIHRAYINALAVRNSLPTIWEWREAVVDGGLLAYGPDGASMWQRAATYVDKILKGAQPGNLPVERPRKFAMVINLKTAKDLGLTIPPSILFQADEVIR